MAATGITNEDMARLDGDIQGQLEQNLAFFEAGMALHDMLAASGHASRVVRSVKELGVSNHDILARTDLRQTITESLLLLKDLLKSIQVKLELEDQLFVLANPGEMVQIWVNLVKNAGESILESGQKNGLIRIKSWLEEQSVHIQVSDNGPGIPHELLPQIFQPDVTTKVEGLSFGLGLGLSIVQRIVENMRGSVGVESLPGKTVFSITLPLSRD